MSLMNDSKDQAQLRQSNTHHSKESHKEQSKDKRKQLRSNTQERVLRMADE
jgi:hypothetical protein